MSPETIMAIGQRALEVMLMLAMPLLLVALVVGLLALLFRIYLERYSRPTYFAPQFEYYYVTLALGALLLGMINNSLTLVKISSFVQMALQGALILAAVLVDSWISRRVKRMAGK